MYDFESLPEANRGISTTFGAPAKCAAGIDPSCLGNEVSIWDLRRREVIQTADLGASSGALMVHWIGRPGVRRAFINAPGTSAIWLADDDDRDGVYDFQQVLGPEDGLALPPDMLLSHDDRFLYVSNWFGNTVQQFDIRNPFEPVRKSTVSVPHPNMLRLSRDNHRLYVTNSLLTSWDDDADLGPARNDEYGIWLFEDPRSGRPEPVQARRARLGQLHQRAQEDNHRARRAPPDALRPEHPARARRALRKERSSHGASHDKPQSFHASPDEALQAPAEEFLYLACLHEGTGVEEPDFLAVVDAEDRPDRRTRRRCRTSATSCTTSAGTAAARPATGPTART